MNATQIKKHYQDFCFGFNINASQVVMGSGAALVMHGLRVSTYGLRVETDDIDLDVPKAFFNKHKEADVYKSSMFGDTEILSVSDVIDLHIVKNEDYFQTEVINGVTVYTLEYILAFKERLNREKDQQDIKNIKQAIANKAFIAEHGTA